jgi:serine/threonine-protein kinase
MIRFLVFGSLELRADDGRDLRAVLKHSKHAALLAYLAVSINGLHRREKITALLWPDLDDARARNALSKAIHHLRRALGDDAFTTSGNESVGLNPQEIWCDASAFEKALASKREIEALDLYERGELLEGFALGDDNGFERWLESARLRFRQKAVGGANLLADSADKTGDMGGAVHWARLASELSPHNETIFRQLLALLVRMGDRAGALTAYKAFEARLKRDLELEPSTETRQLAESLRVNGNNTNNGNFPGVGPNGGTSKAHAATDQPQIAVATEIPARADSIPAIPILPLPIEERRRYKAGIVAGVGLAFVAAAVFLYPGHKTSDPNLIAVGLLRNQTGNAALNPIADMATGNIVQQLAQAGDRVIDLRGSSAGSDRDLARAAGAEKVVGGNIYGKGDSLVVQMQIVDSKNGHVLHQLEPVSVPSTNAQTILDRLRGGVTGAVAALADTLYLPWTTAHSRPPNYAAFQEFMQGLDALVNQGPRVAVDHLKKAIALDTGFVEAKIWLIEQADLIPEDRHLVDSVMAVAISQRPTLAPYDQVSLDREVAFIHGDWEDAYTASRRLAAMAPDTPDAQVLNAQSAMATRRYDEALEVIHRISRKKGWLKNLGQINSWDIQAHRLKGDLVGGAAEWRRMRLGKPEDVSICNTGIQIFAAMGRQNAVDSLITECAALSTSPPATDGSWIVAGRQFRARGFTVASRRAFERALEIRSAATANPRRDRTVAMIQCELSRWKEALETLAPVADTSDSEDQKTLGVIAAHLGDTATVARALKWTERWGRKESTRGAASMNRGFIVLAMGKRAEAVRLLGEASREGVAPAWNGWYVRWELQPLRGDERFEQLIRPQS